MDSSLNDYYAILGLDPGASQESIKVAFRRLAREHHPDRKMHATKTEKTSTSIDIVQLNEAYSVLSNAKRRREYDESLRIQGLLAPKDAKTVAPTAETKTGVIHSTGSRTRPRQRYEGDSTVVSEFSKHLRSTFLADRKTFSWKENNLEGFTWGLEASFWSSHYCMGLRGFPTVDLASTKKFINYSEIAIARDRRYVRKSYFLFLLAFQQLTEWELVSAECKRFVGEGSKARLSSASTGILLLDLQHGRTLRFDTQIREKRFKQLLQGIAAPSQS
jgi:curved DNA-binding protein CbpA